MPSVQSIRSADPAYKHYAGRSARTPYQYSSSSNRDSDRGGGSGKGKIRRFRLGEKERAILEYVLRTGKTSLTPAEVSRVFGWDRRRTWDSFQRLARKGLCRRLGYGLGVNYVFDLSRVEAALSIPKSGKSRKDAESQGDGCDLRGCGVGVSRCVGVPVLFVGGGCNVLRVHGRFRGRLDVFAFAAVLYLSRRGIDEALRDLRGRMVGEFGFSRSAVRRFFAQVKRLADEFFGSAELRPSGGLGIHGLSKLSRGLTGSVEVGVDFVSPLRVLPKFHLKVYTTTEEDASRRPLLDFAKALNLMPF